MGFGEILLWAAGSLLGLYLLVWGLYLWAIRPGRADMTAFKGHYYAHRGLHSLERGIAENTLEAFARAVFYGYGIELDVRLSADQQVVVFHDDTLSRAAGIDKPVDQLTLEQLKELSLFGTAGKIPLFKDVLRVVGGKTPLIVEVKAGVQNALLCQKTWELLQDYSGLYCVESFHPGIVRWFRKNAPQIIRGQLASDMTKGDNGLSRTSRFILTHMLGNFLAKPQFIAYDHKDSSTRSFQLCRKLYHANTVAWTLRSKKELEEARASYDLFIFENFLP
jgi:glycerophosphoryl diester phosphodiesterase